MAGKSGGIPPIPSVQVKSFSCPGCGASLTIRGLEQTEALACGSCGAIVDVSDETYRILSSYQSKIRYEPVIPLGTKGKLRGEIFEAIGYMRRAITVEGVDYEWSEYLLFNPYKGFRWLSEYNGHWNFIKTTTNIPKRKAGGTKPSVSYLGQTFKHFQTAVARVTYVVGEFYWQVQVGETATVTDYVTPPLLLSEEKSGSEVTWSVGEYTEPEAIRQGFKLRAPLPEKVGVYANQPSPYAADSPAMRQLLVAFLFLALIIQLGFLVFSLNRKVFEKAYTLDASAKERIQVTDVFEIPGRASNVVVRSTASVSNNWIFLNMALINDESGTAYDFGREISYYYGVDGGERWSEGSTSDEAVIPSVPAGRYYLRIEHDAGALPVQYSIQVYRDVPRWTLFFGAVVGLFLLPLMHWVRRGSFEYKRWQESDHAIEWKSDDE